MQTNELNKYIKHYLENDHSKSAIMLTGDWGIGKSYYIQNDLRPFLQKSGKNTCVTVSLYGLNTLAEISRSIYLELRTHSSSQKKFCKKEFTSTSLILAKTIVKGVTNAFGVNFFISDKDMQKLYRSINLNGKLIVLEDVERSKIDIQDLLGFVNNLVEQDGAKVLLVTNESELITYEEKEVSNQKNISPACIAKPFDNQKSNKLIKRPTEDTSKYLAIKEKTVSDTIYFEGDLHKAISNIFQEYPNSILNKFDNPSKIEEIISIMTLCLNNNLRSFRFACQKTVDIFEMIEGVLQDDFIQCTFYGILFSRFE